MSTAAAAMPDPVVTPVMPLGDGSVSSAHGTAPRRARVPYRELHGVLLLDKPLHLSSNDALQAARRLLRAEKGGHTGTLDPLATGLLPLCFGAATKYSQASLDADKRYTATLRLGQCTASGDAETPVTQTRPVSADRAGIEAVCRRFTGRIAQCPPMHSALKHAGRPLYDYARAGQDVPRAAREVTIHSIDILAWHDHADETAPGLDAADLVIDVACTKGTYIRSLAIDIGEALGCGAHLVALRRTASGAQHVNHAITLHALGELSEPQREALLLPPDRLLNDRPAVVLDDSEAGRFLTGLRRRTTAPDCAAVRVYGPQPGAFLGTAHITAGELIADRLLKPTEVQALLGLQSVAHAPVSDPSRAVS